MFSTSSCTFFDGRPAAIASSMAGRFSRYCRPQQYDAFWCYPTWVTRFSIVRHQEIGSTCHSENLGVLVHMHKRAGRKEGKERPTRPFLNELTSRDVVRSDRAVHRWSPGQGTGLDRICTRYPFGLQDDINLKLMMPFLISIVRCHLSF